MVEINKLRSANELKGKIIQIFTPNQLVQLADNNSIPHYILTNPLTGDKSTWFLSEEVNDWLQGYFLKRTYIPDSELIFMAFDPWGFKITPSDIVPPELGLIRSLYKLPQLKLNTPPGIYFLCKEDKLMYVGKASNVGSRIIEHKRDKEFDAVYFICCHSHQLLQIEAACIKHFKPILNKQYSQSEMNEVDKSIIESVLRVPIAAPKIPTTR